MAGPDVTAVIPTFRRREALLQALPNHLALQGIADIVVVDDGSDDGTYEAVISAAHRRVRVVRHARNRGLPAARNTGAAAASTEWVVFLEDDCGFPPDYVLALRRTADELEADVVGAPWTSQDWQRAADTRLVGDDFSLLTPPWTFPPRPIETPFMPALALVRRSVFDTVAYDEGYRVNFYREESDFYVSARRAGFTVVLTPETHSWQLGRWSGGCKGSRRVRYDYWAWRNTRRFVDKHGAWLRAEGLLRSERGLLLRFLANRVPYYALGPWRLVRKVVRSLVPSR